MQYGIINYTCCLEGVFFFQMKGLKHKKILILILFKMAANVHACTAGCVSLSVKCEIRQISHEMESLW